MRAYAPHCDQSVLHAPGECKFCDEYPDWQAYRALAGIYFTGQQGTERAPCPSDWKRGTAGSQVWPGNTPAGYGASWLAFNDDVALPKTYDDVPAPPKSHRNNIVRFWTKWWRKRG